LEKTPRGNFSCKQARLKAEKMIREMRDTRGIQRKN
jgi:hypothetical protein